MKKFLVLYKAPVASFEQWMKSSTPEQQKAGMEVWMAWGKKAAASIVDMGAPLGKSLRDIGLLADGKTRVLRERLPAVQVQTSTGFDWYRHERYCFSLDGITCIDSVEFQDSKPFQSGKACTDYHDC